MLVTCSHDRSIRFWDVPSGQEIHRDEAEDSIIYEAVSPDGQTLAATAEYRILRWDVTTFQRLPPIGEHDDEAGPVTFSPDGKWLISGSADCTARVWDLATGEQVTLIRRRAWIQDVAVSPDSRSLAVATGRAVSVHALPSGERSLFLDRHNDTVYAVAFSPDGRWLFSSGDDKLVNCWDTTTGNLHRAYRWGIGPIHCLAVAPDGMTAAATGERTLAVWDLDDL